MFEETLACVIDIMINMTGSDRRSHAGTHAKSLSAEATGGRRPVL